MIEYVHFSSDLHCIADVEIEQHIQPAGAHVMSLTFKNKDGNILYTLTVYGDRTIKINMKETR